MSVCVCVRACTFSFFVLHEGTSKVKLDLYTNMPYTVWLCKAEFYICGGVALVPQPAGHNIC